MNIPCITKILQTDIPESGMRHVLFNTIIRALLLTGTATAEIYRIMERFYSEHRGAASTLHTNAMAEVRSILKCLVNTPKSKLFNCNYYDITDYLKQHCIQGQCWRCADSDETVVDAIANISIDIKSKYWPEILHFLWRYSQCTPDYNKKEMGVIECTRCSYRNISSELGIPVKTVYKTVKRLANERLIILHNLDNRMYYSVNTDMIIGDRS